MKHKLKRIVAMLLVITMFCGLLIPAYAVDALDPEDYTEAPTYAASLSPADHATMSFAGASGIGSMSYQEGEYVSIVATPDEGYTVTSVAAYDAVGSLVAESAGSDLAFSMPASDVTVSATVEELLPEEEEPEPTEDPAEDSEPEPEQGDGEEPSEPEEPDVTAKEPEGSTNEDMDGVPDQTISEDPNIVILDDYDFSTLCLYFEMDNVENNMSPYDVARLVYANGIGFILKFETAEATEAAYNRYASAATRIASTKTIETPTFGTGGGGFRSAVPGAAFEIDMSMSPVFPTHTAGLYMKSSYYSLPFTSADGNSHRATVGDYISSYRVGNYYVYCIQPNQMPSSSLGVYPVFEDSSDDATGFWQNGISAAAKEAIRLVLVYGFPNVSHGNNAQLEAGVTQMLVWEFAMGYRSAAEPYAQVNSALYDTIDWASQPEALDVYNEILASMQSHGKIPSFTYTTEVAANSGTDIKLTYNDGSYSGSATDTNSVLGNFTFAGSGLNMTVNGNSLSITASQPVGDSGIIATATGTDSLSAENARIVVFDEGNVYNIPGMEWYDNGQTLVSLYKTTVEPLKAYVKVTSESFGSVTLKKASSNPAITNKNSCYSLAGATYGLYNNSACNADSQIGTFVTLADGSSNTISNLAPNTYYVKEISPSQGYLLDTTVYTVSVQPDQTSTVNCTEVPNNDPFVIVIEKINKEAESFAGANPLSLAGAKFSLTHYSGIYETETDAEAAVTAGTAQKRTWTITTTKVEGYNVYRAGLDTATGDEFYYGNSGQKVVPHGTLIIKEVTAPTGYNNDPVFKLSGTTSTMTDSVILQYDGSGVIRSVKTGNTLAVDDGVTLNVLDEQETGGVSVIKVDKDTTELSGQGDASLDNAAFDIINNNDYAVYIGGTEYIKGDVVTTITVGANNIARTSGLPVGNYILKESVSPTGYTLSTQEVYFQVTAGASTALGNFDNAIKKGGVKINKLDADTLQPTAQGDATITGAVFSIYNNSNKTVFVDGVAYEKGALITTIQTSGSDNVASTANNYLPYGKYYMVETTAPTGYRINDQQINFQIQEDGVIVDKTDVSFANEVMRGGIEVVKLDADTGNPVAQGDAILAGAEYTVYNNSAAAVVVNGISVPVGGEVMVLTTDEQGYATTGLVLPYGCYSVKETSAPDGYLMEGSGVFEITDIQIRTDGEVKSYTETLKDPVFRGGVKIQKRDADTREAKPQGGATLEGAEFTIRNVSEAAVVVGDEVIAPDAIALVLTTDANGYAESAVDALPYGTYEISETGAPTGYAGTDEVKTIQIREDTVDEDGRYDLTDEEGSFYNRILRGDIEIRKIDGNTQKTMKNVTFRLTALDKDGNEIESHEFTTDFNGYYSTRSQVMDGEDGLCINHTYNTNGGKAGDGIWFGAGDPDDTVGALPYGVYKIEEIETEANAGKRMFTDEFMVYRDNHLVEFNNVENYAIPKPEIGTNLHRSGSSDDHYAEAKESLTLVDTVYYDDFDEYSGKEVTFTGKLMDIATGKPITDVAGKEITASVTKKVRSTGSVEVKFVFDASDLAGKTVVAFEQATITIDGEETVIAVHEDLEDADQTVRFPEIHTTAIDKATGDHISFADGKVTIVDTVTYKNLEPGQSYTMVGTLMDKETGNSIMDSKGQYVTASKDFVADKADGTVDITFTFDVADDLAGKAAVVFEEIPGYATHADLEDEDQTVYFPEIGTTAKDTETGGRIGVARKNLTLVDTVAYSNLIPGKTYTVTGQIMDKETEMPLEGITASKTFTPDKASGTVEVTFTFDGSLLAGKTLVVFEDLYIGDKQVAVHADIEDEGQTIVFPNGGTTMLDSETLDHVSKADESIILVDTVAFENLIPGLEYTVGGVLMDKVTGEALKVNGKNVVAWRTFTPDTADGSVAITFAFDGSALAGKTLVAFEAVYQDGKEVFVHADIEDVDQTVHIPDGHTTAHDKETGDHISLAAETTVIFDNVSYTNLLPGVEYTVSGVLIDKESGEALKVDGMEITSETTFTPDKPDGTVDMTFSFNGLALAGKTVVVFETVYRNGAEVFVHADIEDEEQAVYIPKVQTNAVDGKTKTHTGTLDNKATIIDTVSYSNLLPGKEYTLKGTLMDKSTKLPLKVSGKEVTAEVTFTPESAAGNVDLTYTLDSTTLAGKSVVVFEDLYLDEKLVASHADIQDEGQTVKYPAKTTPKAAKSGPKTGDPTGNKLNIYLFLMLASFAAIAVMGVAWYRNRKNRA